VKQTHSLIQPITPLKKRQNKRIGKGKKFRNLLDKLINVAKNILNLIRNSCQRRK